VETFLDPHPGFIPIGGRDHLIYVVGLLVVATALIAGRRWVREHVTPVRRVLFGVMVAQQLTLYGFYAWTGWIWADSLPLHISRVSAILVLVYLATGSRRVMDVLFFFGLWAWASFSYPQNVQPATNVVGVSFWVNHVLTLLMPFFAVITTSWRPTARALWRAYGWFLLYVALAVAVNALTGGNYFYQRDKPVLPMVPQPWYLLLSLLAALALFWLGYAVARLVLRRLDSRG
jgi:hypothetical integral membrane protein (TIGR02206 family)